MRHSLDPWREASTDYLSKQVEIESRDGTLIAIVPFQGGKLLLSEARANVKLILAAPLLLKAAHAALNWLACEDREAMDPHDQNVYDTMMETLRAATKAAKT